MQHALADQAILNITKPASELTQFEGELVAAVVRSWQNSYNESSNASVRGNVRLHTFVQDMYNKQVQYGSRAYRNILDQMSDALRNIQPWGMLPANLKD